jgi:hemerythrin-like metal-binding protein
MDKIEWSEQFESGIPDLDAENLDLLNMINGLIEIRNNEGKDLSRLSSLLSQMQDYALRHFNHEERYMKKVHQKDFLCHKEQHTLFKKSLAFFCFGMLRNQDNTFLDDFCKFLTKWFISHTTNFNEHISKMYCEKASQSK